MSFDAWLASVREAAARGPDALEPVVRRRDADFATPSPESAESWDSVEVRVVRGQLDADPNHETVVSIAFLGAMEAFMSRREHHWLGFFDRVGAEQHLVGSWQRALEFCNWDDSAFALTMGFDQLQGMWVQTQDTSSCGTLISIGYRRDLWRLREGSLERVGLSAPEPINYDRMALFRQGTSAPD